MTAGRTPHEQGTDDFTIIEARHELGGRTMSHTFGAAGEDWTVEVGANWVQGTQTGSGLGAREETQRVPPLKPRFYERRRVLHRRNHGSEQLTTLDCRDV